MSVTAECYEEGNSLIVIRCPACGGQHYHGRAAAKGEPPTLGHRVSHCANLAVTVDYELVLVAGPPPPETRRKKRASKKTA